ncbi:hypothetical protein DL93DRAFT_2053618, partial [Clavulina sp. PMI_390]
PLLIYNYAVGGATVDDVVGQVRNQFLESNAEEAKGKAAKKDRGPGPSAPWKAEDSLFVFWVGINDCASSFGEDISSLITELLKAADSVYDAGARNFMFIDVPPIERAPVLAARPTFAEHQAPIYKKWNSTLAQLLSDPTSSSSFTQRHPNATVFQFSSYDVFTRLLDDPESFTSIINPTPLGSTLWWDHLHPSSATHAVVAFEIEKFLRSQEAGMIPLVPSRRDSETAAVVDEAVENKGGQT